MYTISNTLILLAFVSSVAGPVLYVLVGSVCGRRLLDLGAAVPIAMALSGLTVIVTIIGLISGSASYAVAVPILLVALIMIIAPIFDAAAMRRKRVDDVADDEPEDGLLIDEPVGEKSKGFSCQPKRTNKIGDGDVNENPKTGGYVYNPGLSNLVPTTIYAYKWKVTFKSTDKSLDVIARVVGWIHPWYKPAFMDYDGPFIAKSKGTAAISCSKSSDKCVAGTLVTKPDVSVKSEYSSGVVVTAKSSGDTADVEASAMVALKGNVAITGGTAGVSGGGVNVGVTLTVPNTAVDQDSYNQSLKYQCKKVTVSST